MNSLHNKTSKKEEIISDREVYEIQQPPFTTLLHVGNPSCTQKGLPGHSQPMWDSRLVLTSAGVLPGLALSWADHLISPDNKAMLMLGSPRIPRTYYLFH